MKNHAKGPLEICVQSYGKIDYIYVKSFFPRKGRLWSFLPLECFPLTYNLDGFKSRTNRNVLTARSF